VALSNLVGTLFHYKYSMMLRITMAVLCVGAVSFLLRVLFALLMEATREPARALKVHLARFNPGRQQGELIVMSPEAVQRNFPVRTGERMARFS